MQHYFLFLALTLLIGCSRSNERLAQDMAQQLQPVRTMTHGYRVLNLDSLASFAWDRLYFFKQRTRLEDMNALLGFRWDGPAVPESHVRLLFVSHQKVVSYTDFYYSKTYAPIPESIPLWMFGCSNKVGYGVNRKSAKFAVFRDCSGGVIDYKMVPLECVNHFRVLIEQGCTEETIRLVNQPHLYDSTGKILPIKDTAAFFRSK
jgi:hypothetical protein